MNEPTPCGSDWPLPTWERPEQAYAIWLKQRPRRQRVAFVPMLVQLYRKAGCSWWQAIRFSLATVLYRGHYAERS